MDRGGVKPARPIRWIVAARAAPFWLGSSVRTDRWARSASLGSRLALVRCVDLLRTAPKIPVARGTVALFREDLP